MGYWATGNIGARFNQAQSSIIVGPTMGTGGAAAANTFNATVAGGVSASWRWTKTRDATQPLGIETQVFQDIRA